MEIKFYYNSSEKNKIGKSLSNELVLTGNLRDECSVTNPVISVNISSLVGYNYCYITEFNRYYYITDIVSVRTNLWRVTLSIDVLESFKNDILNLSCIVDKQHDYDKYNNYIDDGSYINEIKTFTEIANFQSGFNEDGEFILITAGAIQSSSSNVG